MGRKKKQIIQEPVVTSEPPVDPRAAYNCEPCKGEGLLDNGNICDRCKGTGKV